MACARRGKGTARPSASPPSAGRSWPPPAPPCPQRRVPARSSRPCSGPRRSEPLREREIGEGPDGEAVGHSRQIVDHGFVFGGSRDDRGGRVLRIVREKGAQHALDARLL